MGRLYLIALLILSFMGREAMAEPFISLDELLTAAQRWKLDVSLQYINTETTQVSYDTQSAEIFPGLYAPVTIPVEEKHNRDTLVGSIGLKYGWSAATELSVNSSFVGFWQHYIYQEKETINREFHLSDIWIGVTQRLIKEDEIPAVFVFFETAAFEHYEFGDSNYGDMSFKSYLTGMMVYKSIDPMVLGVYIAYQLNRARSKYSVTINPSESFTVKPSVNFAVNDELTLTWGFTWIHTGLSTLNGRPLAFPMNALKLDIGFGYAVTYEWSISMFGHFAMTDGQDSSIAIQSSYRF